MIKRWWERLTLPQALAFAAGLGALYLFRDHLPSDLDGWKQWAELGAYVLAALATAGTLTHGRTPPAHAGTVDSSRSRAERRERGTMPPPAALALLVVALALPQTACTPAQKVAFEGAVLSALELAAKAAGRVLLDEAERALKFGDAGGEEP